jgi:hypothetical protein
MKTYIKDLTLQKKHFISIITRILNHFLYGDLHVTNNTQNQEYTAFPKSRGHFTFLGAIRVVWRKFHAEDPHSSQIETCDC